MAFDIRYATPEDDLRPLWRACFHSEDEEYFRNDYRPQQTLIVADGSGPPAAMLHMLPQTLWLPAHTSSGLPGRDVPIAYVMGIGTLPEYRGRGFAGDLVEQLLFELHLRGFSLAALLPCGAPMARFYARYGFRQLGVMPVGSADASAATAKDERILSIVTRDDAAALSAMYEQLPGGAAFLRRTPERWSRIAEEYELRLGRGRYRVFHQGTVLEDSAAALGCTEVSACVKVVKAAAVQALLEDLGYHPVLGIENHDPFCPWNGRQPDGGSPEDMLEGLSFYVNLMYNERAE